MDKARLPSDTDPAGLLVGKATVIEYSDIEPNPTTLNQDIMEVDNNPILNSGYEDVCPGSSKEEGVVNVMDLLSTYENHPVETERVDAKIKETADDGMVHDLELTVSSCNVYNFSLFSTMNHMSTYRIFLS